MAAAAVVCGRDRGNPCQLVAEWRGGPARGTPTLGAAAAVVHRTYAQRQCRWSVKVEALWAASAEHASVIERWAHAIH
eukprot:2799885-Rhodomonas_salina.2